MLSSRKWKIRPKLKNLEIRRVGIVGAHTSKNSGNRMCEIKAETARNTYILLERERGRKRRMLLKKITSNQHMSSSLSN